MSQKQLDALVPGSDFTAPLIDTLNTVGYAKVPAGQFVWSGAPLSMLNIAIDFTSPVSSRIVGGTPFVNGINLGELRIKGVSFWNMPNPFNVSFAPDYGGRHRIVDDVEFHGCTGTILDIPGTDTPYWRVRDVTIDCPNATGIHYKGFTDESLLGADEEDLGEDGKARTGGIELRAYKIGVRLSGVAQRMRLQAHFMHVQDPTPGSRIDVLVEPSHSTTAIGGGVDFTGLWHGNEGRTAADRFIVFADVDAKGNPILDKPSTGRLAGMTISRCFAFTDYPTPYIFSTTDDIADNDFGFQCRKQGVGAPLFLQTLSGKLNTPWEGRDVFTEEERQLLLDGARAAKNFAWDGHPQLGITDGIQTGEDGKPIPKGLPLSFIDWAVRKFGKA